MISTRKSNLAPMCKPGLEATMPAMTTTDYLIDSALVLLVLFQIKEREVTIRSLIRPAAILSIAVFTYLHGIPTAGNDLILIAAFALMGALIGVASGQTMIMRSGPSGKVLGRAGWASAFFWVLGMGSRFAFLIWAAHGGAATIASFSGQHSITSQEAWTAALLAMAVFEVCGRTLLLAMRRYQLQGRVAAELA